MAQQQNPITPQGNIQVNEPEFQFSRQNQVVISNQNTIPMDRPILYSNQQITLQEQQYLLNQSRRAFIKDQQFQQQKAYAIKILSMFLLWTFIYLIILFLLLRSFESISNKILKIILFVISFILMFILDLIGFQKKYRKYSALLFSFTIITYTTAYFIFYSNYNLYDISLGQVIAIQCLISYMSNILATILLIIYLSCSENTFRVSEYITLVVVILVPISIWFLGFYFCFNFVFFYSYLLGNVIKQIMDGRFKLQTNQVIAGTLAANYGIFIPCKNSD